MELFDDWADRYEQWFDRPLGKAVLRAEMKLISDLFRPRPGDRVLDVGCGTGIFTRPFAELGARVTALDISLPMLTAARRRLEGCSLVVGAMQGLPFGDETFDHLLSVTALEFVAQGSEAVRECFRVVRPGGTVVIATLNSRGLWAWKRRREATRRDSLFRRTVFRDCRDLKRLAPEYGAVCKTAVHFPPWEHPLLVRTAPFLEKAGSLLGLKTGAFVAVRWVKRGSVRRAGEAIPGSLHP